MSTPASYPSLDPANRVLGVIPHFDAGPWLEHALRSLVEQTRPLDGIVVIDDASAEPPTAIVERYPGVTLLRADRNAGPYQLVQQVIDQTGYDAYMFQDADDWSMPTRLEVALSTGRALGSPWVGCQGWNLNLGTMTMNPTARPFDVNEALRREPASNPMHHPTSVIHRDLVERLGGFATGLRYSGDVEFLRRAVHVAKVVNASQPGYVYRRHPASLTGNAETGSKSPVRRRTWSLLWHRSTRNQQRAAHGLPPHLDPIAIGTPVRIDHLMGPTLAGKGER